jgi:hypothetical protein
LSRLERVEDLDDSMAVLLEVLVCNLHIHLRSMFLQAQIRVLLKPPRLDLAFADAAKHTRRRFDATVDIFSFAFSKLVEEAGEDFAARAQ